jgi:hypothetical protein
MLQLPEDPRHLDRYKYSKKAFFEFFLRFLGDFVAALKANLEYLKYKNLIFTLSTGTKSEKYHFFAFGTGTKTPRIRSKKFKKSFFWVFVPVQIAYFWT